MPTKTRPSRVSPRPNLDLGVEVRGGSLNMGPLTVTFHRTLRIPDNDSTYPLPPSLGHFPVRRVADYLDTVPENWRQHGGVFIPLYQREAMWLGFGHERNWKPSALKVAVGKVNALSGKRWSEHLHAEGEDGTQDYVVVPGQPWLDGINAGDGFIKQFVAMPLGMGYTVEGQVTGKERHGGLQLCLFEPKAGRFPNAATTMPARHHGGVVASANWQGNCFGLGAASAMYASMMPHAQCLSLPTLPGEPLAGHAPRGTLRRASTRGAEMGLAAGGQMRQRIHPDPHGLEVWDQSSYARCFVHIVNSEMWTAITGENAPRTPVNARTYAQHGFPWFTLYDEHQGDIKPAKKLKKVKSVAEKDAEHGFDLQDDSHVNIGPGTILPVGGWSSSAMTVTDGNW